MRDQGSGLDFSRIDQIDRFLMGIRVDKGAFDSQLLLIDLKQRQTVFRSGLRHAEQQNRGTLIRRGNRLLSGKGFSYALDYNLSARNSESIPQLNVKRLFQWIESVVRAQGEPDSAAVFHWFA